MAIDRTALKTALDTDARYDVAVRAGKNRDLLTLLQDPEAGQTVFQSVARDDVLEAIGDGIRGLTVTELESLKIFTAGEEVDFRKSSIRAELQQIFTSSIAAQGRLQAIETRTRSYGEAFGVGEVVSLRDLWAVLPQISKSYMAQYLARG